MASADSKRSRTFLTVAIVLVALLVLAGGVVGFLSWRASRARESTEAALKTVPSPGPKVQKKAKPEGPRRAPDTAAPVVPPAPSDPAPPRPVEPTGPRELSDLKPGKVTLEKAAVGSLVYAVGMLTNDSSHQRYEVRIEIALLDASGKPAGVAKDYRPVLEPGEIWRFRGMILDSRARSGTISLIAEAP